MISHSSQLICKSLTSFPGSATVRFQTNDGKQIQTWLTILTVRFQTDDTKRIQTQLTIATMTPAPLKPISF